MRAILYLLIPFVLLSTQCADSNKNSSDVSFKNAIDDMDYWKDGKAEVNVYSLKQNRYNAVHSGQLISVFVTEDFLYEKQVKNEQYTNDKSTKVLKNIQIRKFKTGIYDYSVFSSVFTALDRKRFPHALKASGSSQEWCGNTYLQFNRKKKAYKVTLHSYFETENDYEGELENGILENELFTLIRMNPNQLPTGTFQLIPALFYIQLKHADITSYETKGSRAPYEGTELSGKDLMTYTYETADLKRVVKITYEKEAPYQIVGWSDTYPSSFDGEKRTTEVVLQHSIKMDYWNKNAIGDTTLREEIGL